MYVRVCYVFVCVRATYAFGRVCVRTEVCVHCLWSLSNLIRKYNNNERQQQYDDDDDDDRIIKILITFILFYVLTLAISGLV